MASRVIIALLATPCPILLCATASLASSPSSFALSDSIANNRHRHDNRHHRDDTPIISIGEDANAETAASPTDPIVPHRQRSHRHHGSSKGLKSGKAGSSNSSKSAKIAKSSKEGKKLVSKSKKSSKAPASGGNSGDVGGSSVPSALDNGVTGNAAPPPTAAPKSSPAFSSLSTLKPTKDIDDDDYNYGDDDIFQSPLSPPNPQKLYHDEVWEDLPPKMQHAYSILGYNQQLWDAGMEVPSNDLYWEELSVKMQEAASVIGYTQEMWDAAEDYENDGEADMIVAAEGSSGGVGNSGSTIMDTLPTTSFGVRTKPPAPYPTTSPAAVAEAIPVRIPFIVSENGFSNNGGGGYNNNNNNLPPSRNNFGVNSLDDIDATIANNDNIDNSNSDVNVGGGSIIVNDPLTTEQGSPSVVTKSNGGSGNAHHHQLSGSFIIFLPALLGALALLTP